MCPLWPFHIILLYICFLIPMWFVTCGLAATSAELLSHWNVTFDPQKINKLIEGQTQEVKMLCSHKTLSDVPRNSSLYIYSEDPNIASIGSTYPVYLNTSMSYVNGSLLSTFNVSGNFLGYTHVIAQIQDNNGNVLKESSKLDASVVRKTRPIDLAFTYSVVALVSIIYINMGCALDWQVLKQTLKRPIGPIVGFVSQFVVMPLLSFGLAKVLFVGATSLQLGMFVTGCSPGGGASNIWALTLGGNLDLSITMTTISTLSAFAMIPLWVFSLGQVIFAEHNIVVPYYKIATFAISLIVPLAVGMLIQRFLPRVGKWMVRILKPFALFLIVFIVVFAIYTNLYLFQLFSWQIVVSGLGLPWLGYTFGAVLARVCGLPWADILAVGLETGIQNTGLAIFMLRFTLGQPAADLATVVPVAVAIMTPIPCLIFLLIQRLRNCQQGRSREVLVSKNGYTVAPTDGATPTSVYSPTSLYSIQS